MLLYLDFNGCVLIVLLLRTFVYRIRHAYKRFLTFYCWALSIYMFIEQFLWKRDFYVSQNELFHIKISFLHWKVRRKKEL